MLKVDFHSHSIQSVHAVNTLQELLMYAHKNNMAGMAITDHSPGIDNTFQLFRETTTCPTDYQWIKGPDIHYFHVLLTRYQPPDDIPVHLFKGMECSILSHSNRNTDLPLKLVSKLDIIIASVHTIPHLFRYENRDQVTEKMINAMQDPIDIIGHPCQRLYCPHLEPVVKKAAEKGIAMELNCSSLHLKKATMEDTSKMLKLAIKFDCLISLGSDAHMCCELGSDKELEQLLSEVNFPRELIVNNTLETAMSFSEKRKSARQCKK